GLAGGREASAFSGAAESGAACLAAGGSSEIGAEGIAPEAAAFAVIEAGGVGGTVTSIAGPIGGRTAAGDGAGGAGSAVAGGAGVRAVSAGGKAAGFSIGRGSEAGLGSMVAAGA